MTKQLETINITKNISDLIINRNQAVCNWQAMSNHLESPRNACRKYVPQLFDLLLGPPSHLLLKSRAFNSTVSATETKQVAFIWDWSPG